jgi:hypothetical protein
MAKAQTASLRRRPSSTGYHCGVVFLVTCQQTTAGEMHFFTSGGPRCVCGKRSAVFSTGDDQERPTLRLIKSEEEDPPSLSA